MNKKLARLMLALWAMLVSIHVDGQEITANKEAILQSVEKHKAELIRISDAIWAHAELAFEAVT
jgi:aminobenzoyl-glutamate utilization protein B